MNTGKEILESMLLGKIETLHPDTLFLFSRTGLIHLFSASGFHMASAQILANFAMKAFVLFPLSTHRWLRFLFPCVFFFYFGHLTEWSSPLVRALTFALLLELSKFFESPPSIWRVFLYSALAALLFGNSSLLSLALSLIGMLGILLAPQKNIFYTAVSPWLFTAPLVIWYFQIFSLLAPLWNLTFGLLWSVSLLPLAIFCLLCKNLGLPLLWLEEINGKAMEISINLLQWFSFLDFSFWVQPLPFFILWILVSAFFFVNEREEIFPRTLRFLAALVLVAALGILIQRSSTQILLLDVGQGDAIFLQSKARESILIDTGRGNGLYSSGAKALERAGIGGIDHLFLTHMDHDHIGGLPLLLLRHPVKTIWVRKEFLQDPAWEKYSPFLQTSQIRFYDEPLPEGVTCFLPPAVSRNEMSPFCRFELLLGETLLSTGDAGHTSEDWLLKYHHQDLGIVDYLKIGHHGSKHSSSREFIEAIHPRYALLSVGAKNRYGHPHPDTLSRLKGIKLLRSDDGGSWAISGLGSVSERWLFRF